MNKVEIAFFAPIALSLALSLGVWLYSWKRRAVIGASAFSWFVLTQIIYTSTYILELLTQSNDGRYFGEMSSILLSRLARFQSYTFH